MTPRRDDSVGCREVVRGRGRSRISGCDSVNCRDRCRLKRYVEGRVKGLTWHMHVVGAVALGDVTGWIGVAGTVVVALLSLVPPLWVTADVDPSWQVQAHVRLMRPWPRGVTMLQPIKGMPPRLDRWFGRRGLRSEALDVVETEWEANDACDGFFGVKPYVIDLEPQPEGTEVVVVVKCGSRSKYSRAKKHERLFDHGN